MVYFDKQHVTTWRCPIIPEFKEMYSCKGSLNSNGEKIGCSMTLVYIMKNDLKEKVEHCVE